MTTTTATPLAPLVEVLCSQIRQLPPVQRVGAVTGVAGLIIESDGPNVGLGELCLIRSARDNFSVQAEVVGFREHRVLLMPLGGMAGLHVGCEVAACAHPPLPRPDPSMLGRVLDALGRPFDGLGLLPVDRMAPQAATSPHPLRRQRIHDHFVTGVRALDAFTPFGRGQRLGLFAGSGVGKSMLMGMIARGSEADVIVVALVGERGREVREFNEKDLGPDAGRNVLLIMDSVTRFAMAQREIGLAVGEPPATRGYTPSVFALLPRLLERAGAGEHGTITAIYTVLVEGDDMNEPVADAVRGILDGHIVLSRALAHFNHYPAIDVLESVSRLTRDVCTPEEITLAGRAREHLALFRKHEDLVSIGAYQKGTNPALDDAILRQEPLRRFLCQSLHEHSPWPQTYLQLKTLLA
ncbi:MAG: EscN/YscN/HrcN family type III secretion system ATPase [Opitutales bacterium]|nr:EscN/YscN/HrcN family type III secretion system ATPase [Opitutales bacterium]